MSAASQGSEFTPPLIAITIGEPAGIGPEVAIRAAWALRAKISCVLIGDAAFLTMLATKINPAIRLLAFSASTSGAQQIAVIDCPLAAPVVPGQLNPHNGLTVLRTLDIAIEGALRHRFDAIVTAPLQKSTINDAGVPFTGHTEYLADKTNTKQVVMMLVDGKDEPTSLSTAKPLRVALATTHLALKDVPAAITYDGLLKTIHIIHHGLQQQFGLSKPRILVTGLNPHAGEGGYLGREEIDVIHPVILAAQAHGMDVHGPYPADTLFQPHYLQHADCVLAMYHDQGLPVLKHASFGGGVNITLGLPIIRTSVDHGTALDLASAGLGHADYGSMCAAIKLAAHMATITKNQKQ